MNLDLNELTFDNISTWPKSIKVSAIAIICLLILGIGYWLDTRTQLNELADLNQKEIQLRQEFETKQRMAANLEAYKFQLNKMYKLFDYLLKQLPVTSEVPGLLEDISKLGVASGLEFQLFKPLTESKMEFYSELPIDISVVGNYHQLGKFISSITALDRIVTVRNFEIGKDKASSQTTAPVSPTGATSERLVMNMTAVTYGIQGLMTIHRNEHGKKGISNGPAK